MRMLEFMMDGRVPDGKKEDTMEGLLKDYLNG